MRIMPCIQITPPLAIEICGVCSHRHCNGVCFIHCELCFQQKVFGRRVAGLPVPRLLVLSESRALESSSDTPYFFLLRLKEHKKLVYSPKSQARENFLSRVTNNLKFVNFLKTPLRNCLNKASRRGSGARKLVKISDLGAGGAWRHRVDTRDRFKGVRAVFAGKR